MLALPTANRNRMACPKTLTPRNCGKGLPSTGAPRGYPPRLNGEGMRGFKNFLMRGDVIIVAVGLVVALAFSMLITAFTNYIINPLIQSFVPGKNGLGVQIRSGNP